MGKAVTFLFAACCFLMLPSGPVQAQPVKNILVLHEGWEKWPSSALVSSQLQAVFGGDGSFETHFFQEYVDQWRLGRSLPDVAEALHRKYSKQKFDLIVAVGFVPFNLLLSQGTKDFRGVPVVFVNVGDFELPARLPKNITGVAGHLDLARTVELGLRLQPDTRHLFLVSGSSDYERFVVRALQPQLRGFAERLDITDLSDLRLEQLLTRVSQLPDHSMVFFLTMLKDTGGQSHIPSHICSLLSASANAPLYAFVQGDINSGIVGGSIYSVEDNAREAAEMALEVLKGARVQDLPIRRGPRDEIIVDWRQLQRWHIPQSRVPKNAAVLFREPGTWERYRWYVVATITMLLLQSLLIAALIVQGRRRAEAEKAVQRRLEMETLISETSARFINLPAKQIGPEIEGGLDRARSFLNVEGIFLYGRAQKSTDFHVLHLTRPEKIGLMFPVLSTAQFPWAVNQLKGGHALLVESMDQLPPEAVAEWAVVAQWGIKSFAAIPLEAGGEVLGLLVVAATTQQRGWPQEVVQQLQILGDIFYQAVLRARAEEAALESEERFALVADCAPMLMWMSDPDKLSTYFNKGWLDFTGRTLEQELGDGWIASVHPEDLARLQSAYSQAFDNRKEFKLECRLRRQDGQYRWIMDCGTPRYTQGGTFCGYIGSGIDITDLKRSQQELEKLSARLIHAQEEERKRIARELHDNFGQRLTVLSMELAQRMTTPQMPAQVSHCLHELSDQLKEVSRAMNVTAQQLHSAHLEVLGLVSALEGLCDEFSRQFGIQTSFAHSTMPPSVSPDVALCLFRIVQEGLQNVAKHSGALSCEVALSGSRDGLHLFIKDPGIGFDTARLTQKPGLGLVSMRERLRQVGGRITVDSKPSEGTRLEVRVPFATLTTAA